MERITRHFEVDGYKVTLTGGVKAGRPLVVLGILKMPDQSLSEISNIAIEYPMKSATGARAFVVKADDDVIRRGIRKYEDELADVASRVNKALLMPYNPHKFETRGSRKAKGPA